MHLQMDEHMIFAFEMTQKNKPFEVMNKNTVDDLKKRKRDALAHLVALAVVL